MNTAGLRPLDDRVAVRLLPDPPDGRLVRAVRLAKGEFGADADVHYAEVVAVGPGRRYREGAPTKLLYRDGRRRPMQVKPGDRVLYGRFDDHCADGMALIQEGDIIGVLVG